MYFDLESVLIDINEKGLNRHSNIKFDFLEELSQEVVKLIREPLFNPTKMIFVFGGLYKQLFGYSPRANLLWRTLELHLLRN